MWLSEETIRINVLRYNYGSATEENYIVVSIQGIK